MQEEMIRGRGKSTIRGQAGTAEQALQLVRGRRAPVWSGCPKQLGNGRGGDSATLADGEVPRVLQCTHCLATVTVGATQALGRVRPLQSGRTGVGRLPGTPSAASAQPSLETLRPQIPNSRSLCPAVHRAQLVYAHRRKGDQLQSGPQQFRL